ncbi:methyltransferase domain-containing protein [Vagococcus sp. BWB3-3]|uniref:Methyltransferase domain-containing protein n=1 Tax=Vagococcus allomyrinae TaxID=2794353 RepID=A0A940P5K0_9ENTE|nr:class I SAM-dependent methyltransferase [Vagococcus allomyrinae]MBP1041812.1 methyltransferase domain-containing protein [Vagococcus allomyrinae]
MKKQIQNYYQQATETPWGKLFYDVVFQQLKIGPNLKVLDFGSGFGFTAAHYGGENELVAIEPSLEMIKWGKCANFQQLVGGEELLGQLPRATFDWIICHNVLEYVDNQEAVLTSLLNLLKPGGRLSLIKHHLPGAIIQQAVLMDAPQDAMALLEKQGVKSSYFGAIQFYEESQLVSWCQPFKAEIVERFGIRSMYGLSQNEEAKQTNDWYQGMLRLEAVIAQKSPFAEMAFYRHLIIEKKCEVGLF